MTFSDLIARLSKNQHIRVGVPLLAFVFMAPLGLKIVRSFRYEYTDSKMMSLDEARKMGIEMKKPEEVSIEAQYETMKKLDIENWESIRIPRPWSEENS